MENSEILSQNTVRLTEEAAGTASGLEQVQFPGSLQASPHHRSHAAARVAIVGTGHVGSTIAYALMLKGNVSEIILVGRNREHAEGEAMDLNHGMLFTRSAQIRAGDYSDCAGADIVVITAGAAQRVGETRMDLLKRNIEIFKEILPRIAHCCRDAILIVITNPVDVMTYAALKISGFEKSQVIGSGTVLDTARLRFLLSQRFHIETRSVHAYVIGEHGDSQVVAWSLANISGTRLDEYGRLNGGSLDPGTKSEIERSTRTAAYEVIRRKGATFYAIAAGVSRIVEAIAFDENCVLTVSSLAQGEYGLNDLCLSLPSVVNRNGVERILELPLDPAEQNALVSSARTVSTAIGTLQLPV